METNEGSIQIKNKNTVLMKSVTQTWKQATTCCSGFSSFWCVLMKILWKACFH